MFSSALKYQLIFCLLFLVPSCGNRGSATSVFTDKFYVPTYPSTDKAGTTPVDLSAITSNVIGFQNLQEGIIPLPSQGGSTVTLENRTFKLTEINRAPCPSDLNGCDTNDSAKLGISSSAVVTDLDYLRKNIRDQGERGTCVAFALAGAVEILEHNAGTDVDLSEQNAYFLGKEYTNSWTVSGLDPFNSIATFANSSLGFCPSQSWPYNTQELSCTTYHTFYPASTCSATEAQGGGPDGMTQDPVAAATSNIIIATAHQLYGSIGRIRQALYRGYPVMLSIESEINFNVASQKGGVVAYTFPEEDSEYEDTEDAGHTPLAVGYQDDPSVEGGGYIIIKNSWGPDWGDGGLGYLTYKWVENTLLDAQAIVSITHK